jgi:hypothetical protein
MVQRGSTAVAAQTTRQAVQQRGAEATKNLRARLHLPSNLSDTEIFQAALAEAAAEETKRNALFAGDIRRRYDEIAAMRGQPARRAATPGKKELEPLVAIRHTGARIDPTAPPDPQTLKYVYGDDKLDRALQDYLLSMLKQTSARIEAQHPGTKPTNRADKQSVIDYIVKYS